MYTSSDRATAGCTEKSTSAEQHASYGRAITALAETATWLAQQPGMEDIAASRKTLLQITTISDDENGDKGRPRPLSGRPPD